MEHLRAGGPEPGAVPETEQPHALPWMTADTAVKQEDRPWHPVFLNAHDESATPPSLARGCGSGAQPNRMKETYGFSYGFPGEPAGDGTIADVSDGPQPSATARVLIGIRK